MSSRRRRALCAVATAALSLGVAGQAAAESKPLGDAVARAAAPSAQLNAARALGGPRGGRIHRYRQRVGGLPVFDAELVVADPAGSRPIVVADDTVSGIEAPRLAAAMGRADAVERALEVAGVERAEGRPAARLGVDARSGRLAWEVVVANRRPAAEYLVVIDARSGESLRRVRDLLFNLTGTGAVFDPNPVVTRGGWRGLRDRNDRASGALDAELRPVALQRLTSPRGCLTGVYADARVGRKAKRVCRAGADFAGIGRADRAFEAVMAYFHVDRTRAYIETLDLSAGLRRKPQRVRANAISADNSYYSSKSRAMTLGTGGVDDGEDADVIVHEYGHSLQDQATRRFGRSIAAGSMGEGFGDYLAAAMSARRTGGLPFDVCIFDWDAVSYARSGCGRRADRPFDIKRANRRCFKEIHCTGEVWSSALFELRGRLGTDGAGRSVMDRVLLESHFMLTPRASFRQGANALLAADQMLYGGAHASAIEAEMIERRYCSPKGC